METVPDRLIGTKLGRYQIEALLGRGRGATVYRALDPVVNRRVAIKVLDPSVARDRAVVEAFLRDTRILAELRHPHILPIYEASEQKGHAFFVRLLTDGGTLQSRLRGGKQLPLGEAAAILRPVATALDYAHRQNIIHRNLRPSNILLAADEHVYVTDFSLPGKENQSSAATTIVNATTAPAYVSPEQARGAALDGRSDIYVLTVILYEALVGRPPFQAETPSETARTVIARHLQDEPPAPSGRNPAIGQNVDAVLLRGLEKNPEKRYPTAAALFYALSEAEEQDRSARRQATGNAPARAAEARPTPLVTLPAAPPLPATPAATETDLDDLLATLTIFDTPPAGNTEAHAAPAPPSAPPPHKPPPAAEPGRAEPPAPSSVAEIAPPAPPTEPPRPAAEAPTIAPNDQLPPPNREVPRPAAQAQPSPQAAAPPNAPPTPRATERTPQRSPLSFIIGGVVVLALVVALAIFALTRGGQATPDAATTPDPAPTVAAQGAGSPAPASNAAQPSAVASAATASPAPTAAPSVAPTAVAAVASAQPTGPVRREAIVYAESQGAGKATNLIAMGPDGKDRRQLASLPGNAWGLHIAIDGRSVVYAVGAGATNDQTFAGGLGMKGLHDLYLLNFTGPVTTRLTTTTAWNAGWSWSPDGKTLAFTSNRDGNADIYLLTFPEQQVRRLTTNAGQDAWPTWTPDGKAIIFMSTRDGYAQLYRMDANGGNTTRLITSESVDSFPIVSPDGGKIAYISQNFGATDGDIFVANLDGSNATRLTNTADNGQPTWSPDGTRLAFASKRDGNYNIYTIRADGTGLARLTDTPLDEVTPSWGTVELPPEATQPAPGAHLPLLGAAALGVAPWRRGRHAEDA